MGGWWRWALISPDGVAPSWMVDVSASVNLPLHHKVQKFSSGTGSPGWSRKKGRKTVVVVVRFSRSLCICCRDFHLTWSALLCYLLKFKNIIITVELFLLLSKLTRFYTKLKNMQMTLSTKNITVMVLLFFAQYMRYRTQIMQRHWEYALMTNCVKFMQQLTSPLSEGDSNVCNLCLLQSMYLINRPQIR